MSFNLNYWPDLVLSEREKQYVAHYEKALGAAAGDKPEDVRAGVVRPVYRVQLIDSTVAGDVPQLQQNFTPSGRETHVFAFTFTGNVDNWLIAMRSQSGQLYFAGSSQAGNLTPNGVGVTTLCNVQGNTQAAFQQQLANTRPETMLSQVGRLFVPRTPPIILRGGQALIFNGQSRVALGANTRSVLNIAVHVWEFPGMQKNSRPAPTPADKAKAAAKGGK